MSFLVVFNGQFSPHQRVSKISNEVPVVSEVRQTKNVSEFRNVLTRSSGDELPRQHSPVLAYSKQERTFQEQKKSEHARDIMSSPVEVIRELAPLSEARKKLERNGFRHLPVVGENNTVVGMISDRELMCANEGMNCHEAMIKKIMVCEEQTSIREIAIMLLEEKINALPVVNKKRELVGIITLTDILDFVIRTTPFLGKA